jgi:hypothetical protein
MHFIVRFWSALWACALGKGGAGNQSTLRRQTCQDLDSVSDLSRDSDLESGRNNYVLAEHLSFMTKSTS